MQTERHLPTFPKIFHLGDKYTATILDSEVEITEKIDGSQFVFGKINGELKYRSKGTEIIDGNVPNMFNIAVDYAKSIRSVIPDNLIFYCEYLNKPKHNVLGYSRVPKNNLILFGVSDISGTFTNSLAYYANLLNIESVPVLFQGKAIIDSLEQLLEAESILGGTKIEGFVVKNYEKDLLLGGQVISIMCGKFVSEAFKEKHDKSWKTEHTSKGGWDLFCQSYHSEARWNKAVQHLQEKNELGNSPKDIGNLLKEIKHDVINEEKELIKDFLWEEFSDSLLRAATAGFPDWYKKKLLDSVIYKGGV